MAMRDIPIMAAAPLALILAGCAATQAGPIEDREAGMGDGGECAAEPAQRYIGRTASSETGTAILTATGSRIIRNGFR